MTTCVATKIPEGYSPEEREKAVQALQERHERNRQDYETHKAERIECNLRNYYAHRDEKLEYANQRYKAHKAEKLEYMRQYYEAHKEERAEFMSQYEKTHRSSLNEYLRRYRKEHPEIIKSMHARRRALLVGADGNFTAEEFKALCESFNNCCFYCEKQLPLTPDHMIPLCRGGSNSIENIVPACWSCNSVKGAKTFDEFVGRKVYD